SAYTKDYQLTGSYVMAMSPASINEFRLQVSTRRAVSNAGDRLGPEVNIAGVSRFGRPIDADTARRETRTQFVDNVTVERGNHELKTGITVNHVRLRSEMRDGFGGLFTFRSADDFMAGRPSEWRQSFGLPPRDWGGSSFGAFLQDRYRPIRGLTLDVGVRYDVERLPEPFPTDFRNVSPRIGIAWNPSSPWIVRTGFGIYYDRVPLAYLNRAIAKDGTRAFEEVAGESLPSAMFASSGGGSVAGPIPTIAHSIYSTDPKFVTPYSLQANASIERLVSRDVTIRADYLFTRGVHLLRTRNINLLPPLLGSDGRTIFGPGRIDPQFDAVYRLESSAASSY